MLDINIANTLLVLTMFQALLELFLHVLTHLILVNNSIKQAQSLFANNENEVQSSEEMFPKRNN